MCDDFPANLALAGLKSAQAQVQLDLHRPHPAKQSDAARVPEEASHFGRRAVEKGTPHESW